jgi:heme exporter protein B
MNGAARFFRECIALIYKEFLIEWKQKYAFGGLLLYVLSMVTVVALGFLGQMSVPTWNVTFWIIVLFAAVNTVARSFLAEQPGQMLYLYGMARPEAVILAKICYHALLLGLIALAALAAYLFLSEIGLSDPLAMAGIVLLGSATFAANLTLVSAIAARAENRSTLLAVLSFPLVTPLLLLLIRLSLAAIEGRPLDTDSLALLAGICAALGGISVVLFPVVWRD